MEFTVSIIGAGPAGLSASIQLNKFGIDHSIYEKNLPGGLLRNGNLINNYPGIYPAVSGEVLSEKIVKHFKSFGQRVIKAEVESVDFDKKKDKFVIRMGKDISYSDFLIVASGTIHRKPELFKTIPKILKSAIYFEIDKLIGLSGKKIAIVGGGDCAFDYSLSMSLSNNVIIFNRSVRIRALKELQNKVAAVSGIDHRNCTEVLNIKKGKTKLLNMETVKFGKKDNEDFDLVVFAVGRVPMIDFLNNIDENMKNKLMMNSKLLFAGDVKNGFMRQAVIASGDGVESSMKIEKKIKELKWT